VKKVNIVILFAVMVFGLMACINQKSNVHASSKVANNTVEKDIREIVWEQLKPSQKELIKGTWSDAKITKIFLKSSMGKIDDVSYIGKEVYLVDFSIKTNHIPNNMIIYADKKSGKIVGYGYVD
jgi:hypothetical protein